MVFAEALLHGAFTFFGLFFRLLSVSDFAIAGAEIVATVGANPVVVSDAIPTRVSLGNEVCEARTINYITHTLPQSCLTSSWKVPLPTSDTSITTQQVKFDVSAFSNSDDTAKSVSASVEHNATETTIAEPAVTTFMSFEDWKEMMLRRAGQDPQALRSRKPSDHHADERHIPENGYAGFGEEGEISLNFDHYGDTGVIRKPHSGYASSTDAEQQDVGNTLVPEDGMTATVHLSKDAGKTCKERFSYSSFDAGATILKTSPGAKNAKAILVENKDTYMLLECDSSSKYVIIELSDDISVDTVVLANFEFFSSMIRHFRVSVSDRYPVKIDKWRELGTFEARNSRDIQPFLIENPQIWAKYVRIEFLTHFGNEYYCPVSLLRIHGSRMLDSWKESETSRDDDTVVDMDEIGDGTADNGIQNTNLTEASVSVSPKTTTSTPSWNWPLEDKAIRSSEMTCPVSAFSIGDFSRKLSNYTPINESALAQIDQMSELVSGRASAARTVSSSSTSPVTVSNTSSTKALTTTPESHVGDLNPSGGAVADTTLQRNRSVTSERLYNASVTSAKVSTSGGQTMKPRNSGTAGSSPASPTMQEGFFNAITKRLHYVEANLTLSMKYIEDQSKHIQKQQAKIASFLDELNKTVLAELHNVREQYDQIWQSTVLVLESQRERTERDMMALSSRLNLLADEVVFQKRMAIVQAIILLSCLFLIIFSRGLSLPSLVPLSDQSATTAYSPSAFSRPTIQLAQRVEEKHEQDSHNCSLSLSMQDSEQIHDNPTGHIRPRSNHLEAGCELHDIASSSSTIYQRMSSTFSSSHSDDLESSDSDVSTTTSPQCARSHHMPGITSNNFHKTLSSLPEHPPSCSNNA